MGRDGGLKLLALPISPKPIWGFLHRTCHSSPTTPKPQLLTDSARATVQARAPGIHTGVLSALILTPHPEQLLRKF